MDSGESVRVTRYKGTGNKPKNLFTYPWKKTGETWNEYKNRISAAGITILKWKETTTQRKRRLAKQRQKYREKMGLFCSEKVNEKQDNRKKNQSKNTDNYNIPTSNHLVPKEFISNLLESVSVNKNSNPSCTSSSQESGDIIQSNVNNKCDKRDYISKRKYDNREHPTKHMEVMPFQCNKCSFHTKSRGGLGIHQRVHRGDFKEVAIYGCSECYFVTVHKTELEQHQYTHHNKNKVQKAATSTQIEPYKYMHDSDVEREIFDNSISIKIEQDHLVDIIDVENHDICIKTEVDSADDDSYSIFPFEGINNSNMTETVNNSSMEDKRDDSVSVLYKICRTSEVEVDRHFSDRFKKDKVGKQPLQQGDTARVFQCSKCSFQAKTVVGLENHQIIHKGSRQYQCENCPYKSKSRSCLTKHRRCHIERHPLHCDQCTFTTKIAVTLRKHLRLHVDSRRFQCEKCPYKTHTKKLLQKHENGHKTIKNFTYENVTQVQNDLMNEIIDGSDSTRLLKGSTKKTQDEKPDVDNFPVKMEVDELCCNSDELSISSEGMKLSMTDAENISNNSSETVVKDSRQEQHSHLNVNNISEAAIIMSETSTGEYSNAKTILSAAFQSNNVDGTVKN